MNNWLNNALIFLLPRSCLLCQTTIKTDTGLCEPCSRELPYLNHVCPQCSIPLPSGNNINSEKCGQCQATQPYFDHALCVFSYQLPIDKLIQRLKFNQKLTHAKILGKLLQNKVVNTGFVPECIVPMPLHIKRFRKRGFNQALEIARPIAQSLNVPIDTKYCQRVKDTAAQSILPAKERAKNIRNAFEVSKAFPYKKIAILDDVITTGQTVNALAQTLKSVGVEEIAVWAIARAVLR